MSAQKNLKFNLLRLCVTVAATFVFSWNAWQISETRGGQIFVDRGLENISRAYSDFAYSELTQSRLENRILRELKSENSNWGLLQSLRDIADHQGYLLSIEVIDVWSVAYSQDHSLIKSSKECLQCMWNTQSCDGSIALICGLTLEITPIGDVTGLARAGISYTTGDDVDEIDAVLSAVGLGATALTVSSWGTTSPVTLPTKVGAATLKFANLTNGIPKSLSNVFRRAAADGIDWAKLGISRTIGDVRKAVNAKALSPVIESVNAFGEILTNMNTEQALMLLKATENVSELKQMSKASEVLQSKTAGFVDLFGKKKVLRLTLRLADEIYYMLASLLGLIGSALFSVIMRGINKLLTKIPSSNRP